MVAGVFPISNSPNGVGSCLVAPVPFQSQIRMRQSPIAITLTRVNHTLYIFGVLEGVFGILLGVFGIWDCVCSIRNGVFAGQ